MSDLTRFSLSIEKGLFKRLEALVAESGYSNRSEFIRDLVRDHLVQQEWGRNEEAAGTITLLYDHHTRDLSAKLTHLQHHHVDLIISTTHVHLDHEICMEVIIVKGRAREIQGFLGEIRQIKGVLHANLSASSTGRQLK